MSINVTGRPQRRRLCFVTLVWSCFSVVPLVPACSGILWLEPCRTIFYKMLWFVNLLKTNFMLDFITISGKRYYKVGQLWCITKYDKCCYKVRQSSCTTRWGKKYYKVGQFSLQTGADIAKRGNFYYKIRKLLQSGVMVTKQGSTIYTRKI